MRCEKISVTVESKCGEHSSERRAASRQRAVPNFVVLDLTTTPPSHLRRKTVFSMPSFWKAEPKKPDTLLEVVDAKTASIPRHMLLLAAFALGIASTLTTTVAYRRLFKRIPNGEWVTPDMLAKRRWLKGKVVR